MTTIRVKRRDGSIFDAQPGYILKDGESLYRKMALMDGASAPAPMTDEQVLDAVRAEMRPKDTSRLSAAQLRRAFVAMKMPDQADAMLAKSDSYIEGAFRALTADMNASYIVNPKVAETDSDGLTRDAATSVVVDGLTITDAMARAAGHESAAAMASAHTAMAATYETANSIRCEEWKAGTGWEGVV